MPMEYSAYMRGKSTHDVFPDLSRDKILCARRGGERAKCTRVQETCRVRAFARIYTRRYRVNMNRALIAERKPALTN